MKFFGGVCVGLQCPRVRMKGVGVEDFFEGFLAGLCVDVFFIQMPQLETTTLHLRGTRTGISHELGRRRGGGFGKREYLIHRGTPKSPRWDEPACHRGGKFPVGRLVRLATAAGPSLAISDVLKMCSQARDVITRMHIGTDTRRELD
jgi:hypothetical protein